MQEPTIIRLIHHPRLKEYAPLLPMPFQYMELLKKGGVAKKNSSFQATHFQHDNIEREECYKPISKLLY